MKRGIRLILCLLTLLSLALSVQAQSIPDLTRTDGSITVTMGYAGAPVDGGTLALYQVGQIRQENGDHSFRPSQAFRSWSAEFNMQDQASQARSLADFALEQGISPLQQKTADSSGTAVFSGLTPGLYLLVQTRAAEGFAACDPFLVAVPNLTQGVYLYQVDASPKVSLEPEPLPPGMLPQTGQLNWPIPVLAVLGMLCFCAGWFLYFGKRENDAS